MRLFVYGSLMRGEPRHALLRGGRLAGPLAVPGRLFDTGMGYPLASFHPGAPGLVHGEMYILEDPAALLGGLVTVGGHAAIGTIEHDGAHLSTTMAARAHTGLRAVESGSWRRHGSLAHADPVGFALLFSESQKHTMREPAPGGCSTESHAHGELPVLVTAPHATGHMRLGKMKFRERHTDSLALLLHARLGTHALYTHWASTHDPNFLDGGTFKGTLASIVREHGIRLVLDLHGTTIEGPADVYPGVGEGLEFLGGGRALLRALDGAMSRAGLTVGGLDVFRAVKQKTVSRFAARTLGVSAMQLEIHDRARRPHEDAEMFLALLGALESFIGSVVDEGPL